MNFNLLACATASQLLTGKVEPTDVRLFQVLLAVHWEDHLNDSLSD